MLRLSLQDLALRIKILEVKVAPSIAETLAEALDPPSAQNVVRAVNALIEVGALDSTEEITSLGLLLSKMPVDVHLGASRTRRIVYHSCAKPLSNMFACFQANSSSLARFSNV